jgi:hypothetical protein
VTRYERETKAARESAERAVRWLNELAPFAVTFRNPAGRLQTWTRFAPSLDDAIDSAGRTLREEYPDGRGGSAATLLRVEPTPDPRD